MMSEITLTTEVIAYMAQNGIFMASDEEIIPDNAIHHFQELDEHRGKKSGWYIVINNSYVSFGSWKGDKFTLKLKHYIKASEL
jgi:hypothetical protein